MKDDFKKLVGKRIREARKAKGLTQEDLAALIEKTVETVSNIERGHFHKAQFWVSETFGDDHILAQMLSEDQRWIGLWIAIRIAIEHPKKDRFVETLNFSLEADRNIRLPTWRFIHEDYEEMKRPQNLLDVFEICINNLLKFYEDLQIVLLEKQYPI